MNIMDGWEERRRIVMAFRGAWPRKQLDEWKVPTPAPPGWWVKLILYGIPYRDEPVDRDDNSSHDDHGLNQPKGKSNV
jgi:hypothetical protein